MVEEVLRGSVAGKGTETGAGVLEKTLARSTGATGQRAFLPGPVGTRLRKNFDKIAIAMGNDKKAMRDLRDIADVFDRMDASLGTLQGSPTAQLTAIQNAMRSVLSWASTPLKNTADLGDDMMRKSMVRMMMNPKARDLFLGITKAKPSTPARMVSRMSTQLGAIMAREMVADATTEDIEVQE